jgi:cell division GTPase FtsZ
MSNQQDLVVSEKCRVKICAIGEVGCCLAREIANSQLFAGIRHIAVFSGKPLISKVPEGVVHRLLDSKIPSFLGRAKVESRIINYTKDRELVATEISNNDLLLLVGPCGGNSSTVILAAIARLADEMDIATVSVVVQPFKCEGSRRQRAFTEGLAAIKELSTMTCVCSLDKIAADKLGKLVLLEAFAYADRKIAQCVIALFHALSQSKYLLNDREKLVNTCQAALSADPVAKSVALEIY